MCVICRQCRSVDEAITSAGRTVGEAGALMLTLMLLEKSDEDAHDDRYTYSHTEHGHASLEQYKKELFQ
jgi:succinate dehydrogenase/fumarate reductase-like Fe-S protein